MGCLAPLYVPFRSRVFVGTLKPKFPLSCRLKYLSKLPLLELCSAFCSGVGNDYGNVIGSFGSRLEAEGLLELARLSETAPPFIRMEADARLLLLAGDEGSDAEPTAWRTWAAQPGEGWKERASQLTPP